jgi:phytoene/squalene synthetase
MQSQTLPNIALAAHITRAASKQTAYTVRYLVDEDRTDDAYRAYAYFRWVDDWLDADGRPRAERLTFLQRQQALVEALYNGQTPAHLTAEEMLLAELIAHDNTHYGGLHAYIHNMMAVMAFDAERRGHLITQAQRSTYIHWLAVAVTEALHYFIGHDDYSPQCAARYQAASGAHIAHMLRDTLEDADAGYFNIPQEIVIANGLAPWDVEHPAYRAWVKNCVQEARACLRAYLAQVENLRCRIAGYAYIHRFEIVLNAIERENYVLRADYPERKGAPRMAQMVATACWLALTANQAAPASLPV